MHKRIYDKTAVDDLVLLTDISEDGIVANLQARHAKDRIYTFIGPVLLSVNPFKELNGLYSASMPSTSSPWSSGRSSPSELPSSPSRSSGSSPISVLPGSGLRRGRMSHCDSPRFSSS